MTALLIIDLNLLAIIYLRYRYVGPAIFFSTAGFLIFLFGTPYSPLPPLCP